MAKRGKGEGHISQRPDGRWMAQISNGHNPDGSRNRITLYGKTRKEVSEKLKKILADQQEKKIVTPNKILTKEWIWSWLYDNVAVSIRDTTLENYKSIIVKHIIPEIGDIPLQQLNIDIIQKLITTKALSLSYRTVQYIHFILFSAMKLALKRNLIYVNPVEDVKMPQKEKLRAKPLSQEEREKIKDAAKGHRLYAALIFALGTGVRRGELLGLTWSNIDIENKTAIICQQLVPFKGGAIMQLPKTESSIATIHLPDKVVEELLIHRELQNKEKENPKYQDNDLVFCTSIGTPMNPRNFNRVFNSWLKKAGITRNVRVHDLRHTHASILIEKNVNPKIIQEQLRHKDIQTTMNIYAHLMPGMKRFAANEINDSI